MGVGRPAVRIELTPEEEAVLKGYANRRTTAQALALRARIILGCATGVSSKEVAVAQGVTQQTVSKWRRCFATQRLDGLQDEPRPGVARTITDERVEDLLVRTLESKPKDATHWSTRSMARETGISVSSVGRIWRAFGLQPHRSETFKLSTDPLFIDKVRDIVGLYLSPPDRALVLCVDEKSQIQALDRSQPLLPMGPGQIERRTHDYKRHGTTSLFAALDIATGQVIGKCYKRHRSNEFRKFLDTIEKTVPPNSTFTLSWTITPPTKRRQSGLGSPSGPTTMSILPQPAPPGLIRSSAGSLSSRNARSSVAPIEAFTNWKKR